MSKHGSKNLRKDIAPASPSPRKQEIQLEGDNRIRSYAESVYAEANRSVRDSIFPGNHYLNLARYLRTPFNPRLRTKIVDQPVASANLDRIPWACLCDLSKGHGDASRVTPFANVSHFFGAADSNSLPSKNSVLFLRGNPSPEWLGAIGYYYSIHPRFFNQHLDFRSGVGEPNLFAMPTAPSASLNILKLRVTTLGGRLREASNTTSQADLNRLRQQNDRDFESYMERQRNDRNLMLGDSIIRQFTTHDHSFFSIEQDISIAVQYTSAGWIAIVWLDHGEDMSLSPGCEWLASPLRTDSWQISTFPTIQHPKAQRPTPIRNHVTGTRSHLEKTLPREGKTAQTATRLHLDMGSTLDHDLAFHDSFYAMTEVFELAAASETQYLNLMEHTISKECDPLSLEEQEFPSLTNLIYNMRALERHIVRLHENLQTISTFEDATWPRTRDRPKKDEGMSEKARVAALSLKRDYEYLLDRAQQVMKSCERNMQVVMQYASVRESERSLRQNVAVGKVTRLAFFFIPLSFVASVFGMNFSQFGQGSLPLWIFFAIAGPVFIASILIMRWDSSVATPKWVRNRFKIKRKEKEESRSPS